MMKMICTIFTLIGFSTAVMSDELNDIFAQAECKTIEALSKQSIDPGFYSLSPELVKGIAKAFFYQHIAAPELMFEGAYYEFGLYKGFTFWFAEQISRQFRGDSFFFYGFDSFQGLPPSNVDFDQYWLPGAYACSLEDVQAYLTAHGADFSKIALIKGWYSSALFATAAVRYPLQPAAIVVIDSDVYESCCSVLEFIAKKLRPGTIILFDDFNTFNRNPDHGERLALKQFMEKNPTFAIEPLFSFGWHGESFVVKSL